MNVIPTISELSNSTSVVTKTPLLNEGTVESKREEILEYFHKTFNFYESIFECLVDDDAYYARANMLRHPLIFYYGHTAVFYINKLNVAKLINERIDPHLESTLAIGVDEMSWDDLNEAHYDWPTPAKVKAYRDKTREIVDTFIRTYRFQEVWTTVVDVLSNSILFRESFKANTFDEHQTLSEIKNHQKNQRNKIKKINKDLDKLNNLLNQSVVESFVGDTELIDSQKNFIKSVEMKRSELNIQRDDLEDDIYNSKQTEKWLDWRKDFDDDIERLKSPDLTFEEKSKFLKSAVKAIVVTTEDKQTHSLKIEFSLPYVEDQLVWKNPQSKKDGYDIIEGNRSLLVSLDSSDRRQKKTKA